MDTMTFISESDVGRAFAVPTKKIVFIYLFYNPFPTKHMFTFPAMIRFNFSIRSRFTLGVLSFIPLK